MNCVDEGRLRAYLDGELPVAERDDVARHLAGCPECERQAAALRETTAAVGHALAVAGWAPAAGAGEPDARAALARFEARRREDGGARIPAGGSRLSAALGRLAAPRLRPAFAAVSLLVILGLLLIAAPVQSLANDLFKTFRVQQFAAVTVHVPQMTELPKPESLTDAEKAQLATMLGGLGALTTTPADLKNSAREVQTLGEAQQHFAANGLTLRALPANKVPAGFAGAATHYAVSDHVTAQYVLNVQVAKQYAKMANEPQLANLPWPDANQVTIDFDVPAAAVVFYGDESHGFGIVQLASPTVQVPNTVDVGAFRAAVLAMPGLPEDTVKQIKAIDTDKDAWQKTLIIPVPDDAKTENVKINGNAGLLIVDTQGHSLVLWSVESKDSRTKQSVSVLYAVGGNLTGDEALAVAKSLR